jgi:SAM-dependent methyltransferase
MMKRACAPTEEQRFESRAQRLLTDEVLLGPGGSREIPLLLRDPYLEYEASARALCTAGRKVLELGAGTGLHSIALASNGADLTCIDIAKSALECLQRRLGTVGLKATSVVGTMERLPFEPGSFDVIACAGSLSYGDPSVVDREILRVLKKGGSVLFVDSLNHNPIYRLNRWVRYLRHDRTRETLTRIVTTERFMGFARLSERWTMNGYGAGLFLAAPLSKAVGETAALRVSRLIDRLPGTRRMAFKAVLCASGIDAHRSDRR